MNLKTLFELAGVDASKGKAKRLVENAEGRSQNYGAFALWYQMEDGTVQTCQVPPSSRQSCEQAIANKFGIDEDTLHFDILDEYQNEQRGIGGAQAVVKQAMQFIQQQTSQVPEDQHIPNKCQRFFNMALQRAQQLTSRATGQSGDDTISACSGSLERDILVVIFTSPTLEVEQNI